MMNRKQISQKHALALVLMALLLLVSGTVLFRMDQAMMQKKVQVRNQGKLDIAAELVRSLSRMQESGESSSASHQQKNVRFMTGELAKAKAEEGDITQRLFADGAVAELDGSRVIFPEGAPEVLRQISKEDLLQSAAGGLEMTSETEVLRILSGAISDDLYYVSWTGREDSNDPYACLKNEEFQKLAEQTFSGLLLGKDGGQKLSLIFESPEVSGTFSALGEDAVTELTRQQPSTVRIGSSRWLCTYSGDKDGDKMLVWLMPESSLLMRGVLHISLILVTELIIFVTLITYFFSVLSYCSTHELTKKETDSYHPEKLRRSLLAASSAGALTVFASACVFQTMDAIHTESIRGAKELSSLLEYSEQMIAARSTAEKQNEEQRILDYGENIAALIAGNPEMVSREKLQEYCDLFGIDYLMLFDPDGKEIVSSSDYIGFTMDAGLGENSEDFRRLLLGVPAIVHDLSYEPVTELQRQFMGVRVPLVNSDGRPVYGALILALAPQSSAEEKPTPDLLSYFGDENRYCLYVSPESGEILRATDSSLIGKTVMTCGLPERSLQEGYTDFSVFNNVSAYTTTVKQADSDFFYVIYSRELFSRTLPIASAALLFFLAEGLFLGWYCLKDFNAEKYEALIAERRQALGNTRTRETENTRIGSVNDYNELLVGRIKKQVKWSDRTPEEQVGVILKIDVFLLVILPMVVYMKVYGDSSLVRYILQGDWMRGLNMFSFCAILIVSTIGIMILVVCNGFLSVLAGFTGRAGETACRLLYSLIYYLVILSILYYVFEYVGLAMSTYIASLSAVTLALSIGAQGMVSDILAGLLIVFEHQFQVGDIVEIGDIKGKILEIGVRSTKILGSNNEVFFISNSDIRRVVNKSTRNSRYLAEFSFITQRSVERIEELLIEEIPKIGKKYDLFLTDPVFDGFVKATSDLWNGGQRIITFRIKYECAEQDNYNAKNILTREILLLSEREDIALG